MNSTDLKIKRESLIDKVEAFDALATEEKRSLTEGESKSVQDIYSEIDKLDGEIKLAEKIEATKAERADQKVKAVKLDQRSGEEKELDTVSKRFSLGKAVNDILAGREFTGAEKEMSDEGTNELRKSGMSPKGFAIPRSVLDRVEKRTDIDQATSAINSTDLDGYVAALRANAVYNKVGINFRRAVGDMKTNIVTAMNWGWVAAENTAAADIGANLTSKTATPKWCRGYVDVSKTLLAQNPEAMGAIMYDLGVAEANIFDTALFSTASVSNAPVSIAATSGCGTFTEATYTANVSVYSDFIEAIQTLGIANANTDMTKFVTNPILFMELYKAASVLAVNKGMDGKTYSGQTIAGYDTIFTTATTSATATGDSIAGDFASGVKAYQWGGLDLFLDPYTVGINDEVRIVGHKRVDWVIPQAARFVKFTSPTA